MNLLMMQDTYKISHDRAYPPNLSGMYSYMESRGGVFPSTVFFGLQYYIDKYLTYGVSHEDVEDAEQFFSAHMGRSDVFNAQGWHDMLDEHGFSLPLLIKAVPEGKLVPTSNVLMTIENTDPRFPFVTSFFETLLMKLWYPTTIATQSFFIRENIGREFRSSASNMAALPFACHDFGYRGVSSEETAALGGAAHLLSFRGSDTLAGIEMLNRVYGDGDWSTMPGFTIPATEHSVICSFGPDGEVAAYKHLLDTYPTGTISCVSDTYDIYHAVENIWGGILREQVMSRDGCLVIRPDSGNPKIVTLKLLEIMGKRFGFTLNSGGMKVLDPHVRIIYGDGMDRATMPELYQHIVDQGWAAENLVVGSGGGLLQKVDRDTCKFAIKASEVSFTIGGSIDISKNPSTDKNKASKRGRLKLIEGNGVTMTVPADGWTHDEDLLETVFENGVMTRRQTFTEIRELLDKARVYG